MATELVKKTEEFVFNLLKEELDPIFLYHNYKHTERVLKSTREIIENSEITEEEAEILEIAALLHDVGYTKEVENHEERSVEIATKFLTEQRAKKTLIDAVNHCIMETKFKEVPTTKLGKIIRDADASHFGKKYFNEASEFFRKELELLDINTYTATEWRNENIKVLSKRHQFYTDYALKNWQSRKDKNLSNLMEAKKKAKAKLKKEEMKAKYKMQYKNESPERGVQTFFRTTLKNHIKLSDIADTKANILLSVNAIIISVVLSNLISKLDTNPYLALPTAIFTLFSVISMILSVIATRPNVTSGKFSKEDVNKQQVNLSFFGNFHKMKLEDFEWAIQEMVNDKEYIYKALTKDLYFLGVVLERKYRILRITYTIFMIGIVVSLISFAVAVRQNPGVDIDNILDTDTQLIIPQKTNDAYAVKL